MSLKQAGIDAVESTQRMNLALQAIPPGSTNINLIADATKGLTAEQTAAVLSTTALSDADKALIVSMNSASTAETAAALAASGMSAEQIEAALTAIGLSDAEIKAAIAALEEAGAFSVARGAAHSLSSALKGLWATMMANPLTLIITVATALISVISIIVRNVKQAKEEARQAILSASEAAREEVSTINNLYATYKNANKAYESNTGSKEDLTSATDNLLESLGYEHDKINELINEYGSLENAIDAVTKKALEEDYKKILSGYTESKNKATDELTGGWNPWGGFGIMPNVNSFASDLDKQISKQLNDEGIIQNQHILSSQGIIKTNFNDYDEVLQTYEKLQEVKTELEKGVESGDYTLKDLSESKWYQAINSQILQAEEYLKDVDDYANQVNETLAQINALDYFANNNAPTSQEEAVEIANKLADAAAADTDRFLGSQEQIRESVIQTLSTMSQFKDYDLSNQALKAADIIDLQSFEEIKGLKLSDILGTPEEFEGVSDTTKIKLAEYSQMVSEAKSLADELGIEMDNFGTSAQTTFGNIDTNTRQILEWTDENLTKYKDAIESWGATAEDMGDYSTIFGASENFDGVEIAFTPILQTEDGAKLLDSNTMNKYINSLISKATEDDGAWTNEELFKLDTEGLMIDGQQIKGMLADIGETAIATSEYMHYVGDTGAIENIIGEIRSVGNFTASQSAFLFDSGNIDNSLVFEGKVNTYIQDITRLKEALNNLKTGNYTSKDIEQLQRDFPELAGSTEDLDTKIIHLIGSMNTNMVDEFGEQFNNVDSEEAVKQLQDFENQVLELGNVVGMTAFEIDIDAEVDGMEKFYTAMKESVTSTGLTSESIANLKARFQDLEGYDPAKLFEKTENGIHLNTKALRELENEYENTQKLGKQKELDALVEQYNTLTEEINNTSDAARTADLYKQRQNVLDKINDNATLLAQYEGLTSAFHKWEEAQSIGEEGDMYDSLTGGLEHIKELYEQGLVGTNEFRAAVQLMSNEDLSTASVDELIAAYDNGYSKMTRYFQDSSDGCVNFLNDVQKLNSEWAHMNEDGSWEIDFGTGNDQEIADKLGINVESVQAILRKLSDYGFDVNLDSIYTNLDLMKSKAEEANDKLLEIGSTDIRFNFETDDLDYVNEQIGNAEKTLKQFQNEDGTININEKGAEEAQTVLIALISRRQQLEAPAIMNVDTSQLSDADAEIGKGIDKLQDFISLSNDLEVQKKLGVDTTETEKKIQNVAKELSGLSKDTKVAIGIDSKDFQSQLNNITGTKIKAGVTLNQGDIDSIRGSIASIQPESIKLNTNKDVVLGQLQEVQEYQIKDKNFSVNVSDNASSTLKNINSYINNIKSKTVTITTKHNDVGKAQGTAHTLGSAYSSGNWGLDKSGTALVGELGRELVVRDGKFFTIGEHSAEFFKYQKGDIIFNAEQTRQIFANGKITNGVKRGVNYAQGTAFSNGGGTIRGNGSVKHSSSSSSSKSESSSTKGKNALEKFQDWLSKFFDWIEIRVERQTKKIEKYVNRADRAIERGNYDYANSMYGNAITETKTQITNEQKASDKYKSQANKVMNRALKKGLLGKGKKAKKKAASIKEKVANGTINISEYGEKTQEVIKAYQEWYNKSVEAQQAIEELQADLEEYSRKMIENISQKYQDKDDATDTQLDLLEQRSKNAKSASAKNDYLKKAAKKYDTILSNDDKEIKEYNGIINSNKKIINKKNKDLRGSKYSKLKKSAKAKVDKVIDAAQNYVKQGKAIPSGTLDSIANYYAKGYIKGTFYDACIRYNDALDAKKQAETQKEIDTETAKAEKAAFGAQMIENIEQEYQNKEDAIERTTRSKKTAQDLKKARRQDLSQQDYNDLINQSKLKQANYAAEATAIQKQIDDNIAQGLWTTTSQEYLDAVQKVADYQDEVQQCIIEQEELKVSLRDDVYWRTFERAHDAAKRLANVLKGINDLIDDNMLFNSDNELTEFGIAQLSLLTKEYESARKEVENYTNDINNLNALYTQGEYTQQEYIEKLGELEDGVLSSASSMKSSMNEILKLYQNIEKNELDALFEVIEARKKALSAKKEYYDYDKTLKTKNKDVQFLQAQLDALQGVEGLEARAKRAKLQAELAEKQEDLNDTIQEHQMNLSQEALDGLKDSLQEAFDDRWNDIYSDLHTIKELMTGAQNLTAASTQDIAKTLGELFGFYGINSSAQSAINGTITRQGFASGTKSVPRDMLAWTQENRKGEIIIRKSDGAILTPLNKGDSVIPNNLSERLYELAKVNPHTLIKDVNSSQLANAIPQARSFNITQHYDSLLNVEGNVDSTVVTDLEKFAKQFYKGSYEYTTKEIARDARKLGIK